MEVYRDYLDTKIKRICNHKHAEAFMVMSYKCDNCGHEERIWNSRDGITPYIISCVKCNGDALHDNWDQDIYNPNYQPQKGDRIFINYTDEKAEELALEIIDKRIEADNPIPNDKQESFIKSFIERCKMNANLVEV